MDEPQTQHRYADPEGFHSYAERDEWEICVHRQVPVSVEQAWEAWFTSIWEGQPQPVMLDPGEGRSRLGSVRTVPRLRMTERIVSVGLPAGPPADDAVPSISYTVEHFSASSYLGYVRFLPTGARSDSTQILWCVKWTPSLAGRVLFLGGHVLARMLTSAIQQALDTLEQEATHGTGTT